MAHRITGTFFGKLISGRINRASHGEFPVGADALHQDPNQELTKHQAVNLHLPDHQSTKTNNNQYEYTEGLQQRNHEQTL